MNSTVNLLLVDDQKRNLDALEAMLDVPGYQFVHAESADEALMALLKGDFAAIILDIRMPGTSGLELAEMIKHRKRTQHIPILFLTAHLLEETDVLKGYGVGAVDYLSKPVNPDILRSKVAVFVDLFRKTRALAETNQALAAEMVERQRVQEALREANEGLEARVQERTAALTDANRALRESEMRLELALQSASMGTFSHDLLSGHATWSATLETIFGVRPGEFEGTHDAMLRRVFPADRERLLRAITTSTETNSCFTAEFRFLRDGDAIDSAERWMSAIGQPVLDESGRPVYIVGVATDITLRRQAAEEVRLAKEAAEAANRAKDHFLAVLSHELRTPLTPVLTTVQLLLQKREGTPDLQHALELIDRNISLEARLIDDLLDLTRVTHGKLELNREIIDLHRQIERVVEICHLDLNSKELQVRVSLSATEQLLWADPRLQQIFWNLLKNAIKFTPKGGTIEIATANVGENRIQIVFRDSGLGIDEATLPRIFTPFEQGGKEVTRRFGGLGLGLSICKTLVALHGGTIKASSDGIHKGATFTVELPLATAETLARQVYPTNAFNRGSVESSSLTLQVLLVEDHQDTARVMRLLLSDFGHKVVVADSVANALRAAVTASFDLVISDIGLPDGSGLDLVRQLHFSFPELPAIALSGFGTVEDRQRAYEAGFAAHLIKPVDLEAIRMAIEHILLAKRTSSRVVPALAASADGSFAPESGDGAATPE